MRNLFSRARVASGIAALAVALVAGPAGTAQAGTAFVPSEGDFKSCPALPANSIPLLWHCVSVTMAGGTIKMGSLNQNISSPIQINVAVGPQDGKITTIMGGMSGSAMKIPTGINFPGLDSVEIKVEQAGTMEVDGLLPKAIPMKVRVIHWLLGGNCYIGSDSTPITVHPTLSNVRLEQLNGITVIRTDVSDSTFEVPAAAGCGIFNGMVNDIAGLPSAGGKNAMQVDTVVQVRNYVLGNITPKVAAKIV